MKFVDEFRQAEPVKALLDAIHVTAYHKWKIMEICGGQTHAFLRYGLDNLLPEKITLLHGPGCPVCVTPVNKIERAIQLAQRPEVMLCSFGDMLRVPGSSLDLLSVKARGGDVRIVYSPLDAVTLAERNPQKQVVFFAIGFETTAPANAMAVLQARSKGLDNFSILCSQFRVPPAIQVLLSSPHHRIDGFLAAGHVCSVMGYHEYLPLADSFHVPIVVTGFEPLDLTQGILACLKQLEGGYHTVENQYARSVTQNGNGAAQQTIQKVFHNVDATWRGIGPIPSSGLALRSEYADLDAEIKFDLQNYTIEDSGDCISGLVLQGLKKPTDCSLFGTTCTPEHPFGATMVSSEGACAAYYRYKSQTTKAT